MKRALQVGAVVVLLALVGLLALRLVQKDKGAEFVSAIANGSAPMAPTFDLPALATSRRVSLESLRGKVVVVNFWASWCVGCQDEASDLNALAAQWTSDARSFARSHNVKYTLVHASDDSIKDRYGVTAFPETFVINRQGRAVYHLEVDRLASSESLDGALERAVAQ